MRPSALRQLQRIYEASNGKACELGLPAACHMSIVERLTPANEVLDGSAEDLDAGRNVGWGTDAQIEVLPSTRNAPLWWDETDFGGQMGRFQSLQNNRNVHVCWIGALCFRGVVNARCSQNHCRISVIGEDRSSQSWRRSKRHALGPSSTPAPLPKTTP